MIPPLAVWGLAAAATVICILLGVRKWLRGRITAEELERRRREEIVRDGKLGDAEVQDVEGMLITYSYQVAGVSYTVSQDVAFGEAALPEDRMTLVGPATVKYLPRNPANSIVLGERWNGMHRR